MNGVLFAERAIFADFDPVGIVFLILVIVVISLFTFGARQSNSCSVTFCHIFRLPKKLTPRIWSANSFYYIFLRLSSFFCDIFKISPFFTEKAVKKHPFARISSSKTGKG